MNNSKQSKSKIIWGRLFLGYIFIAIPVITIQIIGWEVLAKLMPRLTNYGVWIMFVIAIPWLLFTYAVRRFGRKIGPRAMCRFYTREEMYEILAGSFPINAQRENSLNQELECLYK